MLAYFFDPMYFLFVGPFMLLAWWASSKVKGTFRRYNQQQIRSGISGQEAAATILRAAGLHDVQIGRVEGMLSDHYNPQTRSVMLSDEILHGRTPAAVAVAAHECGHALQHQQGYRPMEWRSTLVPVVQIGSSLATPLIMGGLILLVLTKASFGLYIAMFGVIAFALAVLFHFVTLPVEFDASARAIRILEQSGIVAEDEMPGVRKTLYAAGFTYVASALVALAQLAYFLMLILRAQSED
ncbi:MAG: hypothetical protein CSA62_11125 [Planctomycetota bacterium]|nr:MAG: hypothetical protein CSA62_11125 [Planctomycetota bacterium]